MTDHDALIQQARNEVENLVGPMDKARTDFLSETVAWARTWIPDEVRSLLAENAEYVQTEGVDVGALRQAVQKFLDDELEDAVYGNIGDATLWLHECWDLDSDEPLPNLKRHDYLSPYHNSSVPQRFHQPVQRALEDPVESLVREQNAVPAGREVVRAPSPSPMMVTKLSHYGDLVDTFRGRAEQYRERIHRRAADEVLGDWDTGGS